jgi:hypothetical protein
MVLAVLGAFAYDVVNFLTFIARDELWGLPKLLPITLIPIAMAALIWVTRTHVTYLLASRGATQASTAAPHTSTRPQ